jgi:flagellar assembly protein FliH
MSLRGRVVSDSVEATPFTWGAPVVQPRPAREAARPVTPAPIEEPAAAPAAVRQGQLATVERDAFAKGYEQGERAGAEAAGKRAEAMLRRLSETLTELNTLRATMIRQTELQIVELALAVARRVVHREVSLDKSLLIAIARVALDRLGESANVTVRLHPEEYDASGAARVSELAGSGVVFVSDPRVPRGGCRVESEMGMVEAGVDAQIQEIARALLGEAQVDAHAVRRA